MIPIILTLLYILSFCAYYMYKSHLKNELKDNISSLINSEYGSLFEIFIGIQHNLHLDEKYQIRSEDEKKYTKDILQFFLDDLTKMFWNNSLTPDSKLCNLNYKEYYMYMLRYFLKENEFDKNSIFFRKYRVDMYDEKTVWCNIDGCGDWIYTLTDFSTVYQKVFLICSLFCESNNNIIKIIPALATNKPSKYIIKTLKEGKMDVTRR